MNHLSKAQFGMLLRASIDGVSVYENLNTISALYTRSMIKFTGRKSNRLIVPTKFGKYHISMTKTFDATPVFKTCRNEVRDMR